MIGLLIIGLLTVLFAPAFIATDRHPGPNRLMMWIVAGILVSLEKLKIASEQQPSMYDPWFRLLDSNAARSRRSRV